MNRTFFFLMAVAAGLAIGACERHPASESLHGHAEEKQNVEPEKKPGFTEQQQSGEAPTTKQPETTEPQSADKKPVASPKFFPDSK